MSHSHSIPSESHEMLITFWLSQELQAGSVPFQKLQQVTFADQLSQFLHAFKNIVM